MSIKGTYVKSARLRKGGIEGEIIKDVCIITIGYLYLLTGLLHLHGLDGVFLGWHQ